MVTMREQLDELARLHAAAMAEQTTLAICAYRRALLRDGDALLEYVRELEEERDEARQAAVDLAKKVGIEKVLAAETARADEASQLLRELAEILNPHESYDASKITGWARDTVERAREADVALARKVTDAK